MTDATVEQDPMKPSPRVLIALGSIIVHFEEMYSPTGSLQFDAAALEGAYSTPGVVEWFEQMRKLALLPVKR